MEFQEYPKALYKAGAQHIVEDDEQEDAARDDGWLDWHDDHARLNEPDTAQTEAETPPVDEQPLDREALKARAAELGIQHAPNIKTEKLAELIAAHEA